MMKPTLARARKIATKHDCPRCGKPSNPVTNFGKVRATATLLDLICRYCGNQWSVTYNPATLKQIKTANELRLNQ